METSRIRTSAILLSLLITAWMGTAAVAQTRPNVVFIVLDDVGFADLGCYGSEIRTPNIDRLAASGIRYNNFFTTSLCSPSRAALLTGRNHHTVGMRAISNITSDAENAQGKITRKAALISEILRDSGYNTFALGKWHLTPQWETSPAGPYDGWPLGRGFDRFYGFLDAETDQYHPALVYDNHRIDPPRRPGYHLSEDLVDRSIEFIDNQRMALPDKPFFLYLAFGAAHAPHQAPKEYIDHYKGVFDQGWDEVRAGRLARMKKMNLVPQSAQLAPRNDSVKEWTSLTADEKRLYLRLQETYAGFIEHTDAQIGRLTDYLRSRGQLENTLIVLLSDNGASQEGGVSGTVNATLYYNGIGEDLQQSLARIDEIGTEKGFSNIPWGWAQTANTPFQRYKQNTHFGGVRDPLIISWPAGIKDQGGIRSQFHHVTDITPTVLEILKLKAPEVYHGVPQLPIAGTSLAYTFSNPTAEGRKRIQYFEMIGHRAIWNDGWVAVTAHMRGAQFDADKWELYDTRTDFSAVNDLAQKNPEKLAELKSLWNSEAEKYGVLPLDDRSVQLFFSHVPSSPQSRKSFTFYPGKEQWLPGAAPDTRGKSHVIRAFIERRAKEDGVLAALGSLRSGYSFFIENNHLVYVYNFGGKISRIESSSELPSGPLTVSMEFTQQTAVQAGIVLLANGEKLAEGSIPRTLPFLISWEGFDIGKDTLSPVSPSYLGKGDFAFAGKLIKVELEIR